MKNALMLFNQRFAAGARQYIGKLFLLIGDILCVCVRQIYLKGMVIKTMKLFFDDHYQ